MAACISSLGLRPPSFAALTLGNSQKQGGKLRIRTNVSPVAKFDLAPPPYPLDGLEPHISKTTLEFHWGKHHRAYVDNLNKQIEGTDLDKKTLEEVVVSTYNNGSPGPQFNNAGQIWNHDFYWGSIQPNGGGKPTGELKGLIDRDFGSYEEFVTQFKAAGATQFGSGWAWLVLKKDGKLAIEKTPNAVTPILWDSVPLLVIDVWEHAYYLDYQNRRPDYITTFVEKLISWESAEKRLIAAKAKVNYATPDVPK